MRKNGDVASAGEGLLPGGMHQCGLCFWKMKWTYMHTELLCILLLIRMQVCPIAVECGSRKSVRTLQTRFMRISVISHPLVFFVFLFFKSAFIRHLQKEQLFNCMINRNVQVFLMTRCLRLLSSRRLRSTDSSLLLQSFRWLIRKFQQIQDRCLTGLLRYDLSIRVFSSH